MLLHEEPGILRLSYEEEAGVQIHEWLDYNPEDRDDLVLSLLDRIYAYLLKYPVRNVIVQTLEARGAFSPDVLKFIREVQFPRILEDSSVRFVVTIQPEDQLARMATNLWEAQLKNHSPLILHDVASMEAARAWLLEVGRLSNRQD